MLVIFRSRLRDDVDMPAVEAMGRRMYELASAMPGFVSYEEFAAADGESLALVKFSDRQTLEAWRQHPEHVEVQQRSRASVFSEYHISVCELSREYRFSVATGRVPVR